MFLVSRALHCQPYRFTIAHRAMSQAVTNKYFVYAPDREQPGTHAKRYAVRSQHLKEIQPHIDSGFVAVGGMMVSEDQKGIDAGQTKAEGSILIIKAGTLAEAEALVERDVYYTSGVWDVEKLKILPFIAATPFPA